MKDVLINATQLSCKVGTRYLLNQINWTVHKGEQWVIFGMNGSGKTTLLSIIAGYKTYTKGIPSYVSSRKPGVTINICQRAFSLSWPRTQGP